MTQWEQSEEGKEKTKTDDSNYGQPHPWR